MFHETDREAVWIDWSENSIHRLDEAWSAVISFFTGIRLRKFLTHVLSGILFPYRDPDLEAPVGSQVNPAHNFSFIGGGCHMGQGEEWANSIKENSHMTSKRTKDSKIFLGEMWSTVALSQVL